MRPELKRRIEALEGQADARQEDANVIPLAKLTDEELTGYEALCLKYHEHGADALTPEDLAFHETLSGKYGRSAAYQRAT